jgi:hypothetical protein
MQEYYEKQVRLSGAHVQESEEGEYSWCTLYTRMDIGFLNLLKLA